MSAPRTIRIRVAAVAIMAAACSDASPRLLEPSAPQRNAIKFWEVNATTRWNERAIALLSTRPPATNGQSAVSRMLTYLSVAQYRAVLAAENGKDGSLHPSVPAAVGGASVVVLSSFFPLDVASFVWEELDGWARRLLQDVAVLARAFGWTEEDGVALSPTRREAYLELAGA